MKRAYDEDPRKRKSFVFSFEFFTIIGDDCHPMSWQESDKSRERHQGHIAISRCSSIVALALVGSPIRKLKNAARRAKTQYGYVYSPWSPWHVLNIECYPDWKSNTGSHDSTKHYVNGPEAFLNTLLVEYKDAQKRFDEICKRIGKLITPPVRKAFLSCDFSKQTILTTSTRLSSCSTENSVTNFFSKTKSSPTLADTSGHFKPLAL